MTLQRKIQMLRKERGISQEGLAELVGVSRQAVANWEAGLACPDLNNLIALSDLYRVSIDSLVRDRDNENCRPREEREVFIADERTIGFLLRAKRATYAGKGSEVQPSRLNSHDLEYREEPLCYHDTYLGGEHFLGEEALWNSGVPFWSMTRTAAL